MAKPVCGWPQLKGEVAADIDGLPADRHGLDLPETVRVRVPARVLTCRRVNSRQEEGAAGEDG